MGKQNKTMCAICKIRPAKTMAMQKGISFSFRGDPKPKPVYVCKKCAAKLTT